MYHYTYKITFQTGEYYYGKHSTDRLDDGYKGSGRALKERYDGSLPYEFTIVESFTDSHAAYEHEELLIGELWKSDPLCLNRCPGGIRGFFDITGLPKSKEHRQKIAESNSKKKTGAALAASLNNLKKAVEANTGRSQSADTQEKKRSSYKKYWDTKEDKSRPHLYKSVICDGTLYESVQAVMNAFNVSRPTVINRIKSDKWDWKYART